MAQANFRVAAMADLHIIWQKAFVMERERFDGADIAHILRGQWQSLDWARLLKRFDRHWQVLLSHLILFGYIYPGERGKIPDWVSRDLLRRLEREMGEPAPIEAICRGTFLSRLQYRIDIERWGYRDPRLASTMTVQEIGCWTAAANDDGPTG